MKKETVMPSPIRMNPAATIAAATVLAAVALLSPAGATADPSLWEREWPRTDFTRANVAFDEIISGGPPKDGIPAIWEPSLIALSDEHRIADSEPVMALEVEGERPRAYPIRYLMWHEIVNDEVGGVPVAVTYCPLCNSGMVFDARVNGEPRSFGVSGKLRHSDMIMYDRETESWWQQAIGTGVVGHHMGDELRQLPAWMESWAEFRTRNPDGLVMDEPDWRRQYGRNPYVSYDSSMRPFLFSGEMPPHDIPALMRVVRVEDRAWTFERLREEGEINEAGVTITWTAGQASALDTADIAQGRDVGTVRVRDVQTGADVPHDVPFAFAFHAFFPEGEWMLGD
jgi:hypothetical protein